MFLLSAKTVLKMGDDRKRCSKKKIRDQSVRNKLAVNTDDTKLKLCRKRRSNSVST